jgi:hypothetical protein
MKRLGLTLFAISLLVCSRGLAADWMMHGSRSFFVIFQSRYTSLIPHILVQAEQNLNRYRELFDYENDDPITLIIRDSRDLASASATPFPIKTIRLDIAPPNPHYEFTYQRNHFGWTTSHELMHIIVNDQGATFPGLGKTEPLSDYPLSIPFSVLANSNRYTPLWLQEGIAVFTETWVNGGYGRALSSFDEMVFRTRTHEGLPLYSFKQIEAVQENDFHLQTTSYLYGTRFISWLALHYGPERIKEWIVAPSLFCFENRFRDCFGTSLDQAWTSFCADEHSHQTENIRAVKKYPLTSDTPLSPPQGWVSQAYPDRSGRFLIFATHRPHELACIKRLDRNRSTLETLTTLPTPSLVGVACTAFDSTLGTFFYTTQNNRGFRDLWALNCHTTRTTLLFRNIRMGELAIDPKSHALWGIRVHNGLSTLAVSRYPYREVVPVFRFPLEKTLSHLTISPSGQKMAAVLSHVKTGTQELIIIDLPALIDQGKFIYESVTKTGCPEHPSWSSDGKSLYWNATVTGVSNIYIKTTDTSVQALSNTTTGLFHPVSLAPDTVFAFRYTSKGFQPVCLKSTRQSLTAIDYLGQKIIRHHPELKQWEIKPKSEKSPSPARMDPIPYQGWRHLKHITTLPFIGRSDERTVAGITTEFRDRLMEHQLLFSGGVGLAGRSSHVHMAYRFRDLFSIDIKHDPATVYDLINRRRTAMPGFSLSMEMKKWWVYDLPTTTEQWFTVMWGQGLLDFEPSSSGFQSTDLIGIQTRLYRESHRRRIGSVEPEQGYHWTLSALAVKDAKSGHPSWKGSAELDILTGGFSPHHVFRWQIMGGLAGGESISLGRFHFGGFGNRILENKNPHQYRDLSSLPGLGYRRLPSDRFFKAGVETVLPPLSTPAWIWKVRLRKIVPHLFMMRLSSAFKETWTQAWSAGLTVDLLFQSLYILDSSLSIGAAHTRLSDGESFDQFFLSFQLMTSD